VVAVGGPNNSTGWAIVVAFIGTGPMPIERLTRNKVGTSQLVEFFYYKKLEILVGSLF
jgi:hypothetical protein